MNIKFEGHDIYLDNVSMTWYISSAINDYRLVVEFCGGYDEEHDEINLEGSSLASFELCEVRHNDVGILREIQSVLFERGICANQQSTSIMVNAPDVRESLEWYNESSFDDTMNDINTTFSAITEVLMRNITTTIIYDLYNR